VVSVAMVQRWECGDMVVWKLLLATARGDQKHTELRAVVHNANIR
jgi:hypothetical protein